MMLRNRDLNVQKNVDAARPQDKKGAGGHHQQQQVVGGKGGKGTTAAAVGGALHKRQAAHLVKAGAGGGGPRPKRACSQTDKENSSGHNNSGSQQVPVSAFSRSLLIDSAKKEPTVLSSSQKEAKRDDGEQKMEQDNCDEVKKHPPKSKGEKRSSSQPVLQHQPNDEPLFDFDKENERDMSAMSQYAQDIFTYYKYRERFFLVADYIRSGKHPEITSEVRAKLIDWMVELQETFELNHETLYLAVKLVDIFLNRTMDTVTNNQMQLIASTALFVSAKFDERAPPLIDDFIYLAEDSFTREQILDMERVLLKEVNFDLGSPLSYRFLRRYARVCKLDMGTLTLARYVLETSLMFLDYCRISESRIAAACLLLALRMKGIGDWGPVLHKYTGFKRSDIEPLMWRLNRMVIERKQHYPDLDTIFRKYSHEIFFEVAKIKQLREH